MKYIVSKCIEAIKKHKEQDGRNSCSFCKIFRDCGKCPLFFTDLSCVFIRRKLVHDYKSIALDYLKGKTEITKKEVIGIINECMGINLP